MTRKKNSASIKWMSSKILGWRTRIYILYTSSYPEALDITTWARPLKVSESDLLFGFAYWHKLASMRDEWSTYDMIGVVSADQCHPAFITHMSNALTDDTLLKTGYHQFTMGITRKYSQLFLEVLKKHCTPPLSTFTKNATYNAWICSSPKMDRFIEWFSAKLTPFMSTTPLPFDQVIKIGDSMKVNDESLTYTLVTTMLAEKLIMGYFAADPVDEKMNTYYTVDYDRESKRLAQHEQLKNKFVKSVEPKPVPKTVKSGPKTPGPETPAAGPETPALEPDVLERLQAEYRESQAAAEQLEAEETAVRSILAEQMRQRAINESKLLATLQKSMVVTSNVTDSTITRGVANTVKDDLRQQAETEINRERLQVEESAQQYRQSMDEELAAMRRKAEEDMLASIRSAELESIKQIQLQTDTTVAKIREETERKIVTAKATLDREKRALERAKLMRLELETNRDSAIRDAEEAVQQMRIIEKETRKYALLLEQANSTRQRYESEKTMLVKQIDVEMRFVRSSMDQMETLQREKEQRIRETREEVESRMKNEMIKSEIEASELRKKTELEVIADQQKREVKLRKEIREKEDAYLANKQKEDAILAADIKARRAEYLQQKSREDERLLADMKSKELLYSNDRDKKLELFAIEKRQGDEEYTKRNKEMLETLQKEHEARVAVAAQAHAEEIAKLEKDLAIVIATNKAQIKELHDRQRKENEEYITKKEAALGALKEEHERALAALTAETLVINEKCTELKYILEQTQVRKAENEQRLTQIRSQLNENTLTSTRLEESIFFMRMQLTNATETIEYLKSETHVIKSKQDHVDATRRRVQADYDMYDKRLKDIVASTEDATTKLAEINTQNTIKLTAKLRIEQQLRDKQAALHANTVAIAIAEKTIDTIKTNITTLENSRVAADYAVCEIKEQLKQYQAQYEESESKRKDIYEELQKLLALVASSEQYLAQRRQQLQSAEKHLTALRLELENNTRKCAETHTAYNTMKERDAEIKQEIQQISDSIRMLEKNYIELTTTRDRTNIRQTELQQRNTDQTTLLTDARAKMVDLEEKLAENYQQLQSTESLTAALSFESESYKRKYYETLSKHDAIVETHIATKQEIQRLTDTISMLEKTYIDLIKMRDTTNTRQTELKQRNAEEAIKLTKAQAEMTNREEQLEQRRQQLQNTEKRLAELCLELDSNTRKYDETTTKHSTMAERNTGIQKEIQRMSDTCIMLEKVYMEMLSTKDTLNKRQPELKKRNTTENKLLAKAREDVRELETHLAERSQQLQSTERCLESLRLESENNIRKYDETLSKYSTLVETNIGTKQEIQRISDTFITLEQTYTELVTMRDTANNKQAELEQRNEAENNLLNGARAKLANLEKVFQSDCTTRNLAEETYHKIVAEKDIVLGQISQIDAETVTLNAEKAEIDKKLAIMLSSIPIIKQDISEIKATTIETEAILNQLLEEKQAALAKRTEISDAVSRVKYEERVRATLNEKVAAKRRSLEEFSEAATYMKSIDKTAIARKRAIEEALAARNHIEQNPVRIYILCHNAERFNKAASIYKKYPWAHPILMKYQDCTFENAVWKQLYEIRDEWYNYKMIGTMSFSGYTKINLDVVDKIVRDPATWAAGFHHFLRTETPISNTNHPHLVQIMTDVCRDLELSVPPENYCNYWITSSEKMIKFLIWYEERAYPTVMGHPLIMTDSTYPGTLSKDALTKLCGVPYYPHATFVFERLFLSFFMSLN
jgi:chromosome segregation ATPase